MGKFTDLLSKKIDDIAHVEEVYHAVAESLQSIDKDAYAVCLCIDAETFEMVPIRNIDRVLMKNIQDSLESGICGQIVDPHKSVLITDAARFRLSDQSVFLLTPIYANGVQYGIIVTVIPDKRIYDVQERMPEIDLFGSLASHFIHLMQSLEKETIENEKNVIAVRRFNNVVENVVHGLVALDENNVVHVFNKNAEIIFGLSSSAVVGKSYRESFPEKIMRAFDLVLETTLIEGSVLDYEVEIEIAPTVKIPVGISSSVLLDNQGVNQGIICVCRDMSLTKEVNRLKEINQMKTEFVSMVSHELKNPIAVIKSSVEMLLAARRLGQGLDQEFENETLTSINDEINRLSQLINDILNLARIEAGRIEIKKEAVNIELLLASTTHIFKIHEETHPVTIEVENVNEKVLLDPEKIKQVVINYVNNAIKYSPKGSPIHVRVYTENDSLKISVSDKGIGIPEDKLKELFGKFVRVATPETVSISGTGLGLSICKKIVKLHKGDVWVESKYGEGSTFGFWIPFTTSGLSREEEIKDTGTGLIED